MKREVCYYCDRRAEFYCDFILSIFAVPKEPIRDDMSGDDLYRALMNAEPHAKTCDRPLCDFHRKQVGTLFIDGNKANTLIDSIDMCPGHANIPDGYKKKYQPITGGRAG